MTFYIEVVAVYSLDRILGEDSKEVSVFSRHEKVVGEPRKGDSVYFPGTFLPPYRTVWDKSTPNYILLH